jgi:RNA polymerase subunit RPABC4/transcription elongation factor Spt4
MLYCNQCQLVHGEEHRFCQRCGQLLKGSQASASHACARCGTLTFPGQKFCTECGLPLRLARVAPEGEASPARPPLFYPRRPEGPKIGQRQRRPGRTLTTLIALLLIGLAGMYIWRHLPARGPITRTPATSVPQDDLRREVEKLAEKIRAAHLNKDINKWMSCYNRDAYPQFGRLESQMLELWKNYDIKTVDYRISNVQRQNDKLASADIVWNIQLYDHRTHDYTLDRSAYKIILDKGPDGWRIRESRLEGGGTS